MLEELRQLIETLGLRDWRKVAEAEKALLRAGADGMRAVIEGMEHPSSRVRRACAGFMDHHGSELCVAPLTARLLSDPVPNVRREAVHSLSCQRCKESPLEADVTPLLIATFRNEANIKVRREALYGLCQRMPDDRIFPLLHDVMATETDRLMRGGVHATLRHHDPVYRAEADVKARARRKASESVGEG